MEPAAIARAIIDANLYVVLGTTGRDSVPWISPVFYAARDYTEFYWVSAPETDHSRNLADQPLVSLVVFDSSVPPGTGQAVYMSATAEQLEGADVEHGLEVYPGPAERGGRQMSADILQAPGPYRMYRATVSRHWILCERESGQPCLPHGKMFDHRTSVTLL